MAMATTMAVLVPAVPAGLFASLAPESEEKSASELRRRLVEGQI